MMALRCGSVRFVIHPLTILTMAMLAFFGRFWEGLLILFLVAAHEGAHALAAAGLGLRPIEIRLIPVGGMLKVEGLAGAGPGVEALVAAAGPAFSLLTAITAFLIYRLGHYSKLTAEVLANIFRYSAMLCFFNLLPALPMDGGRILRAFLSRLVGFSSATKMLKMTGLALIGGMTGAATFMICSGHPNLTLTFVTAYLFSAWHRENEFALYDLYRAIAHKSKALKSGKVLPVRKYKVLPGTKVLELLRFCRPGIWCRFQVDLSAHGKGNNSRGRGRLRDQGLAEFEEDAAMRTLIDYGSSATAADVLAREGLITRLSKVNNA